MPLRKMRSSQDTAPYISDRKGREHQRDHPHQRDVIGAAGVEYGAAEPVLRSDELADDGPGQRQPDIDAQHRDHPGQAERHHQLAEDLHAAGAERVEQPLLIGVERLDAGVGGQRRNDDRKRGGDGDLRGRGQCRKPGSPAAPARASAANGSRSCRAGRSPHSCATTRTTVRAMSRTRCRAGSRKSSSGR